MARRIADTLLGEELVLRDVEPKELAAALEPLIFEELMVEDRLNDEIREMLSDHERNIDGSQMDYRKLFDLTKRKLIEERGIIV
jgi:hypothetical protein